ncbi:hypothetical protein FBZ93_122101 [Bradyrhizobium macuxiense]|uniref:Uncharacterized protein n=1 Tax=Bradyrhizobium macuxiense TaxID=1755647 RepID=A0A560L2H6_9BRAD|nr:hypothetical protein FBZ93_122101 [Bradyrhizobium macuxiense]
MRLCVGTHYKTIDRVIDGDSINWPDAAAQLGTLAVQKGSDNVGGRFREVRLPGPYPMEIFAMTASVWYSASNIRAYADVTPLAAA